MKTFPMFLRMQDRHVVIVGGGEQAAQKARLMLRTEARLTLIAPDLDPELQGLVREGRATWQPGMATAADLRGAALVFVAQGCPGADAAVHALAREAGALVNVVDAPDLCEAITPSIVDRDPVVVAIGTEGTAPVLARQIKTSVEQMLEPSLGGLAALAGRLRDAAAQRLAPRQRRDLWRWVFDGPARTRHAAGAERDAARLIKEVIASGEVPAPSVAPVALVGAGVGGADMITLRGVRRLQEADVIFHDRLLDPGVMDLARRDAERVYVGKTPGERAWPQEKINGVLVAAARQGKRVVRLKCGDPSVFGRGAEEADALRAAGIGYEIVPGVTAASAAAAAGGGFLTERGVTDTLVLSTGTCRDGATLPDWATHLRPGTTLALYMGVGKLPELEASLARAGVLERCTVEVTERCGFSDQRQFACRAAGLQGLARREALRNPAMLLIRNPLEAQQTDAVLRVV